jgi:hypothetical protein
VEHVLSDHAGGGREAFVATSVRRGGARLGKLKPRRGARSKAGGVNMAQTRDHSVAVPAPISPILPPRAWSRPVRSIVRAIQSAPSQFSKMPQSSAEPTVLDETYVGRGVNGCIEKTRAAHTLRCFESAAGSTPRANFRAIVMAQEQRKEDATINKERHNEGRSHEWNAQGFG